VVETVTNLAGNGGTSPGFGLDFALIFPTGGTQTLVAKYSGDANYAAATSAPETIQVLYATTLNVQSSATTVTYGTAVTLTATLATGQKSPAITGQIAFSGSSGDQITTSATTPGTDANGNLTLTATATVVSQTSESIIVKYSGDANYGSAVGFSPLITVNIPDFSLSPSSGLSVIATAGQSASGLVTITPATQTPSPVSLTLQPSTLSITGYTIAIAPQQVNLNGAAVTATVTIAPGSSSSNSTPSVAKKPRTHHAALLLVDPNNWFLSGLLTALGAIFVLTVPGRRRRYRRALGLGGVSLLLLVLGCGGGGGGGKGGGGGGSPQVTTVALSTSSAKVAADSPVTITATVTGNAPTGSVTINAAAESMPWVVPVVNGQAQAQLTFGNIGVYQLTASYSGDANNEPSTTTSPLTQAVTGTFNLVITGNTGTDTHSIPLTLGIQ